MKYVILAGGFAVALAMMPSITPAQAQSNEVRQMCRNKYGIDPKRVTTDGQRQEADKKVAACIRSGGKS